MNLGSVLKTTKTILENEYEDEKWGELQEQLIEKYKIFLDVLYKSAIEKTSKRKHICYYMDIINSNLSELATLCIPDNEEHRLSQYIRCLTQTTRLVDQLNLLKN